MAADEKWYFTKEQLANTPSRKCGIDADKELSYRQQAANFIQDMGQRLAVSQLCINTAIVYMHRFYVFHSLSQFHRNAIAAAALFLAAKVEEQPRKLEHVIKVAYMCLHRDQTPPDTKSEQYLEHAQDLVFNENVLLQTLGFDVAIDHPHTHVVRCCHLVKASKDLAQTSYFMASNSLHLTTMCLQYKPTVVACFCIHLACKWSNWEIPQSNEGKHWFWYVDRSVTSELLQQLTAEFLHIFDKCPSRLKRKIMSISATQSPSINHPSLPNSPFDVEPRKVQSPAAGDGGPTFQSNRPYLSDKQEDKKPLSSSIPGRPQVDYREYKEKKERERLEREKTVAAASATAVSVTVAAASGTNPSAHMSELNKHHSHHHKSVSSVGLPNKHPMPPGQKSSMHHNHNHRPEMKTGMIATHRHSVNNQPRDPNRDLNRQRIAREYNSSSGTSGGTMYSHSHTTHLAKNSNPDSNSLSETSAVRAESSLPSQEVVAHGNAQEKLSNNNHSVHRLSNVDCKHQPHDKRSSYDPRHKTPEHRKDAEQQKLYTKYQEPARIERQRKPDSLEQRSEEVRKLIEKPLPPPKPRPEIQKEEYIANMLKQSHHPKYNQLDKLQASPQMFQKSVPSKPAPNQHSMHGVSQILKDISKNGASQQSSMNNVDDYKTEKRLRHDGPERSFSGVQQPLLQTPPGKHKSLFSPEKAPTSRDMHSQRPKSKQKTPPTAAKVPKQERLDPLPSPLNIVSPFASPPGPHQQDPSPSKRLSNDAISSSNKRHRTLSTSETDQQPKIKTEEISGFDTMKMLGRVPDLIQPFKDNPTPTNGRSTSVANDLKPPELIKPFEPEPVVHQVAATSQSTIRQQQQQTSMNGLESGIIKQEPLITNVKQEPVNSESTGVVEHSTQVKSEYLSSIKSVQSINALLQEPIAQIPSLLQGVQLTPIVQQQLQRQHRLQQQKQQVHMSLQTLQSQEQVPIQSQCVSLPAVSDSSIASTVDISVLNTPVQAAGASAAPASMPMEMSNLVAVVEEKKSEHHKSEKKKKKEKHKHKDKDKSKEKHKHKHKDKDKEKHRDKEKNKAEVSGEGVFAAVPIRITIPKDKINLSGTESGAVTGGNTGHPEKNKSPQGTGLKIKIPKERLKGADGVSGSTGQSVVQAPLKIKIRTDAISRSSTSSSGLPGNLGAGGGLESASENRKRERDRDCESTSSPTLGGGPPNKKHTQGGSGSNSSSGAQRPGERQNGRHYSSSSNNKEKHQSGHHKSSSKLSQSQQSHNT
ncbi:cyclin-T isoform X2 [Cephus cinctus]|uniref:Cyclin-T isoform X2 n=1 Tax=Cephus cinctus TaxID=211228 RepID=A0AAJ7RC78_CEPCN|nr:cyclin-T isoform X2 [Cephus cinctus]